jgi:coenzyme PQQ precursor peptide PqqA
MNSDERRNAMAWEKPLAVEICVGMEVTSYESADLPPDF